MEKKIKIKTKDEVDINKINSLINMSYEDFIASRILFKHNKLVQACILANTAIEKYFKALMEVNGTKAFGNHDLTKQLPFIKNQFPRLFKKLNVSFLDQLTIIYRVRYISDLPSDYNFVIFQNKYQAELDYTYSVLEPIIRSDPKNSANSKTKYENAVDTKDPDLWNLNYLLNKLDKVKFIESPCNIYEFRKLKNGVTLEIKYVSTKVKADGKFDYEALIPKK